MTTSVTVQAKKHTMYISTRFDIRIGGDKLQRNHVHVHVHCTVRVHVHCTVRVHGS